MMVKRYIFETIACNCEKKVNKEGFNCSCWGMGSDEKAKVVMNSKKLEFGFNKTNFSVANSLGKAMVKITGGITKDFTIKNTRKR